MSVPLRVLILEDELIIARDLKDIIVSLGHEVIGIAVSVEEAVGLIEAHHVDVALLDIVVKGEKDGIYLAEHIRNHYNFPFIFITSHSDRQTLDRAKDTEPHGYLLKPFEDDDVRVSIEMGIAAFERETALKAQDDMEDYLVKDAIFVKDKAVFKKIQFEDISYIQADSNYSVICTSNRQYTLRSTLKDFDNKLPPYFERIHKSYIVNIRKIEGFNSSYILVNDKELPISRDMQANIYKRLNKI